jgi:hypothetical protein
MPKTGGNRAGFAPSLNVLPGHKVGENGVNRFRFLR